MAFEQFARDRLIFSRDIGRAPSDARQLRKCVEVGTLVRLRRGAYVASSDWDAMGGRERHLLRVRAALGFAQRSSIVAGASAAAVLGMPIAGDWPEYVTLLDEWLGGGRSEPGVRKTTRGYLHARPVTIGEFRCTGVARTAIDLARVEPFERAVGSVDWAMWRKNPGAIDAEELFHEIDLLGRYDRSAHLRRVVGFGTALSDSFGESQCRATMWTLGFDPPQLQAAFTDSQGRMEVDFFWPRVRQVGEFDGKSKYTRSEFTAGDPGETVWREKKREDRLRKQVNGVTRILTEHVMQPLRLERLLIEAGIPRSGGR
jgi:hypothetical protein